MRKANQQPSAPAELTLPALSALEKLAPHIDETARVREHAKNKLTNDKASIRRWKEQITALSTAIKNSEVSMKAQSESLKAMPKSEVDGENVKAQLEKVAKLPWIAKMKLEGTGLLITTREGALKTTFYKRIVYQQGSRIEELLPAPLTLPLPTYEIYLDLKNMGRNWDRSNNLELRLADPKSLLFHVEESGAVQNAQAHWATSSGGWSAKVPEREASWSGLCLSQYASILEAAGKKSIADLLNEVAMYLQNSGWAHAYRQKMDWVMTLGYGPYSTYLLRPLLPSETFASIQEDMRRRLPEFLSKNGLTQHMIDYGSFKENEPLPQNPFTLIRDDATFTYTMRDTGIGRAVTWNGGSLTDWRADPPLL